jgi:signal peptidase I
MFRKRKILFTLAIIAAGIVGLYITGRLTGMLVTYSIPTSSNEPTINPGDRVVSSNLVTPDRLDFICYHYNDPMYGKSIFLFRLCGMPGDVVEIRNGDLYINNSNADNSLNLMYEYNV